MSPCRAIAILGAAAVTLGCAAALTGCGASAPASTTDPAIRALEREARPIGRGQRFHEPVRGALTEPCRAQLGRRDAAHVEIFAEDRVVLLPAEIGVRGPTRELGGRIVGARCYGAVVTTDPTGVVLSRAGGHFTLAELFRAWGQPLSAIRLAAFSPSHGGRVQVFVNGHHLPDADPRRVRLTEHAEIVLEVGPAVPPHSHYTFESGG